jgi:ubiquinone biosynthesis protein COQ4
MADDTAQKDYAQLDAEYMEGRPRPLSEYGSVLMTSSKFLNHARFRDLYAQEGLRRNGRDVPTTYLIHQTLTALAELTDQAEVEALIAAEREKRPDFAAWLDARKLSEFSIADLSGFGSDTLGGLIYGYFSKLPGFELNFTNRTVHPTTDFNYLVKQRTLAHDIEHLLTGLGPNPVGELALIACNLKAYYRYFSPELASALTRMTGFLLSTNVMKINLHYPQVAGPMYEGLQIGFAMGERLKRPLLFTDWQAYLDWPVEAMRRDLNIVGAPPTGTWDWTEDAHRV